MKKIALLLGALSLVSSVAYAKEVVPAVEEVTVVEETPVEVAAAPALTVTYFGQGLEFDNTSGELDVAEGMHFSNSVGLAYDDWTFDLMARKTWSVDSDEGIHSNGSYRIDLDAWKKINDNLSIGARWRQEKDMGRYYLRTKYNYGMFSGNIDVAYQATNDGNAANGYSSGRDGYYVEATPVAVTVGPLTLGYYFKTESIIAEEGESKSDAGIDHWYRHQLRASMPIYQGEKLNVGVQYAWEFANDIETDGKDANTYTLKHDSNSHVIWLNASYAVTENLTISGYYEYDMFEWEEEGTPNATGSNYVKNGGNATGSKDSDKYYGEFYIGWTYTF